MTAPDPSIRDGHGGLPGAQPSVRIESGFAVIRIPVAEVHGLRVALAECPCRAAKSTETANIRQRLERALGRLGGVTK